MSLENSLSKKKVAADFSRAAETYDHYSDLQKRLAFELVDIASSQKRQPTDILDVGTGTGEVAFLLHEKFPNARIVGCDISPGMIEKAKKKNTSERITFEVSDAEALPYKNEEFDMVVSNATFQWVEDLEEAFAGVKRVLKPKGSFIFITFGPKTLLELTQAYKMTVDQNADYLHKYKPIEELESILNGAKLFTMSISSELIRQLYPNFREFFKTIKGVGALNASKGLPKGLSSRKKIEGLIRYYESNYGIEKGVYATYEVIRVLCRA